MKDSDWQILNELYQTPNITRVANLLYITQPSLTKRLQVMEEEFHVKIVKRTAKGVEFTKEGVLLARKAQEYMAFLQQLRRELCELQEEEKEVIIIGASYTYSKYVLTDLLYDYSRTHPKVRFEVMNEQSNILFRKACGKDVDIAFVRGDYDGAVVKRKVDECQAYILSRDPVRLEDLPGLSRIAYKTNDRSRELLDDWWNQTFREPIPVGMSAGYIDVSWQLASKGLGYVCCFLPEDFDNSYDLTLMPITYPDGRPVSRNTWFVYRDTELSKALQEFIDYIEADIADRHKTP